MGFIFKTIKKKSFELLITNNFQSQTIHVYNEYMQGLINILSCFITYFGKFTKISSFNLSHIRWTSPLFILLYETSIMKINAGAFGKTPFYKIVTKH